MVPLLLQQQEESQIMATSGDGDMLRIYEKTKKQRQYFHLRKNVCNFTEKICTSEEKIRASSKISAPLRKDPKCRKDPIFTVLPLKT